MQGAAHMKNRSPGRRPKSNDQLITQLSFQLSSQASSTPQILPTNHVTSLGAPIASLDAEKCASQPT